MNIFRSHWFPRALAAGVIASIASIAPISATQVPVVAISDQTLQAQRLDAVVTSLKAAGRGDFDHADLGVYGWHAGAKGGYSGYYSLSHEAVAQAWRSWKIIAVMETGSDILHPIGDIRFFPRDPERMLLFGPPVVIPKTASYTVVGHRVDYLYSSAGVMRDATVIDAPLYPDGSPTNTLRLNWRAPGFVEMYRVLIAPADYRNYCQCRAGETSMPPLTTPAKAR